MNRPFSSPTGTAAAANGRATPLFFRLLLLCGLLLLSACAAMLDPGPPPARLQLVPSMPAQRMAPPLNKQLTVAAPAAGREIDTDNIALIFNDREVRYLSGARWTSTVPFLVQRNLIEALESANILRGVGNESAGMASDVRLLTDIKQFGLRYAGKETAPNAVFDATFRLLSLSNGKILSTRTVEVTVPAGGKENAALARAVETAFSKALAETVDWVAGEMRALR